MPAEYDTAAIDADVKNQLAPSLPVANVMFSIRGTPLAAAAAPAPASADGGTVDLVAAIMSTGAITSPPPGNGLISQFEVYRPPCVCSNASVLH